jgi:hypothetical protein
MSPSTCTPLGWSTGPKTSWVIVVFCLTLLPIVSAAEPEPEVLEGFSSSRGQKVPHILEALDLIDRWESEAEGWRGDSRRLLAAAGSPPDLSAVNREINRRVRDFLRRDGRPDAPTERNFFYGSSYDFEDVSGSTLPGIRFNLDRDRVAESEQEATLYLEALGRRVEGLRQLRQGTREDH